MRQRVVWIASISLLVALVSIVPSWAALSFSAPASNGDIISGSYVFTVATPPAGTASVEFRFPSYLIGDTPCVDKTSPYTCTWNTGFALDGNFGVEAIARDAMGVTLETATRIFNVNNHGFLIAVTGGDLVAPMSGLATFQLTITDPVYYPHEMVVAVDGKEGQFFTCPDNSAPGLTLSHTCIANLAVITTNANNGTHELKVVVSAVTTPDPPRLLPHGNLQMASGQLLRAVTFANGIALGEPIANIQHAHLAPSETAQLTCAALRTDGSTVACTSPGYASSDTAIATVSAGGMVTAVAPGFATITLTSGGFPIVGNKTTPVQVWVRSSKNIPHFSGSGDLRSSYNVAASFFPFAIFSANTAEIQTTPALYQHFIRSNTNTLTDTFFAHPHNTALSYNAWKTTQDALFVPFTWAAEHGFHFAPYGDSAFAPPGYSGGELLNWPSGQAALTYAVQQLALTGKAVFIPMADEVGSYIFPTLPSKVGTAGAPGLGFDAFTSVVCSGSTCTLHWSPAGLFVGFIANGLGFALQGSVHPELNTPLGTLFTIANTTTDSFDFTPNSSITGTFNQSNDANLEFLYFARSLCGVAVCNPFVPNTAVTTFSSWVNAASPRPQYGWPFVGNSTAAQAAPWIGQSAIDSAIATYADEYWTGVSLIGVAYPWSNGVQVRLVNMRTQLYGKQPYLDLSRPQVLYTCSSGPIYIKETIGGSHYTPPVDILREPGCDGPVAQAEQFAAVALGASGTRQYYYDIPPAQRASGFTVGNLWPTGMRPDTAERNSTELWEALGYSNNLIGKVLQPYILGMAQSSPAYESEIMTSVRRGNDALMLLIVNGNDYARTIAVDFTPYRSGQPIARYAVAYNSLQTTRLADGAGETITLPRGGTVAYIFPFGSSSFPLQPGTITPTLPGGATSATVAYNPIYDTHLAQHTEGQACYPSCTLRVDQRLWPVYYQLTYVDDNWTVVSRSAVMELALDPAPPTPGSAVARPTGALFAIP